MIDKFIVIFCFTICLNFAWPFSVSATQDGMSAPVNYQRLVVIEIRDAQGRPLPDVELELALIQGRIVSRGHDLISDQNGRISFIIEPVIENPMAGRKIKDSFFYYRSIFTYQLTKPGFLPRECQVKDSQEFVNYNNPQYSRLNRRPSQEALIIPITMFAYRDYLSGAREDPADIEADWPGLRNLIDGLALEGETHGFSLTPSSIKCTGSPDSCFSLSLAFTPLFDPEEISLLDVGDILFQKPFRAILPAVSEFLNSNLRLNPGPETVQVNISACFLSRTERGARPVYKVFSFHFKATDLPLIQNRRQGLIKALEYLEVNVNGQRLS